jgi:hypothetical protein
MFAYAINECGRGTLTHVEAEAELNLAGLGVAAAGEVRGTHRGYAPHAQAVAADTPDPHG